MKMPDLNKRILGLIQLYTQGNVSKFAKMCEMASSQKLNRIFKIDNVSKKYPVPSTDIILDISKTFSEIDLNWLIRGESISEEINETKKDNDNHHYDKPYNMEEVIVNKVSEKLMQKINQLTNEIEKLDSKIKVIDSNRSK